MKKRYQQPIVLMYHGIVSEWTPLPKGRETGADLYDVPVDHFQEQMEWLQENQYIVSTLDENAAIPEGKQVVLSFDDGEMNNYEQALPVLKKYGFRAYFFIIAKRIGEPGYMGWDELKGLNESGMIVGSHGFSHEILTNLMDSQIEEELRASKRYLERNLDIAVEAFSMPRGFCNNKVIRMAYDCGYKYIFISDRPRSLNQECLSRISIKGNWTIKHFEQAVTGNIPVHKRFMTAFKNAVKRIFGEGVYDWLRKNLLR